MKTYYSILFTPIRPAINEQVSIALLMIDNEKIFFNFSHDKLNFLRKLISTEASNFIRQYVLGINNDIKNINRNIDKKSILFPLDIMDLEKYSEKYIYNLSKFENNLITFTKPKKIDINLNEKNFNVFFEKFISDEDKQTECIGICSSIA